MNEQIDEENFDEVARQAGDALRRPAPADGMSRIRATRRRQQQVRLAAGGAALAAVLVVGAAVVLRDGDRGLVVEPATTDTAPQPTVPSTTDAPGPITTPSTAAPETTPVTAAPTTPPDTTPPSTVPDPGAHAPDLGAEARAWIDESLALGFPQVDVVAGDGTTARLLVAQRFGTTIETRSALLLDDGRVVATPRRMEFAPGRLYGLGGQPAVVDFGPDGRGDEVLVWRYDPAADVWDTTGDLGLGTLGDAVWGGYEVMPVDDVLVVTNNAFVNVDDSTIAPSPDQGGVVVAADLTVTEMAPTPEGIGTFFDVASGGKAIQMYGFDVEGGFGVQVSYDQPWQYDPATNQWSPIPIPDWFACTQSALCAWRRVADVGAPDLAVPTARGVLTHVPDGTIGLYDAGTGTWSRMQDAPFDVAQPTIALAGDQFVMAPFRTVSDDFATIAVLDLATGAWTTTQLDIPADVEARFGTEWFDVSWDLRVAGTRVLAAPGPSFQPSPIDPIAAYDTVSRTWTTPTAADVTAWRSLTSRIAG